MRIYIFSEGKSIGKFLNLTYIGFGEENQKYTTFPVLA